jgi:hypothetical protein
MNASQHRSSSLLPRPGRDRGGGGSAIRRYPEGIALPHDQTTTRVMNKMG